MRFADADNSGSDQTERNRPDYEAISRRLAKLEEVFAPVVEGEDMWGSMAEFRDDLLRQAEERGEPSVAELKQELEQLGPMGLWREKARGYLCDHGFVQSEKESFVETEGPHDVSAGSLPTMLHIRRIGANSDGPCASNWYASHDVVDSNWPDRDFNFTTKYAADERQVTNLTLPGMSATSVSTRYLVRAVSHKIEGGL